MPSKRISIQEIAAKNEVSERKLRRIARSLELGVGRGKRYQLTAAEAKKLLA